MENEHEILIYINKVKEFFNKASKESKEYFYYEKDAEEFFNKVKKLAIENLENKGLPELTQEQFDSIRNVENKLTIKREENRIFYTSNIGVIYLN